LNKQLFTFCIMVGMPFISMIKIQHTKFENRWWVAWWSPSGSSSYYAGNVSIVVDLGLFHFWVHSSQCFYRNNSQMGSFFYPITFAMTPFFSSIETVDATDQLPNQTHLAATQTQNLVSYYCHPLGICNGPFYAS
jgi:hypothetical protein